MREWGLGCRGLGFGLNGGLVSGVWISKKVGESRGTREAAPHCRIPSDFRPVACRKPVTLIVGTFLCSYDIALCRRYGLYKSGQRVRGVTCAVSAGSSKVDSENAKWSMFLTSAPAPGVGFRAQGQWIMVASFVFLVSCEKLWLSLWLRFWGLGFRV